MDNKIKIDEKKKGVYTGWSWLLWWKISSDELEGQVENYNTLKITKSARGVGFLCCLFSVGLTLIFIPLFHLGTSSFFDAALFLIFGFFMYKGQRWAIISMMILWTFEKAYSLYDPLIKSNNNATSYFMPILWWCLYMHAFYLALKVENIRRKAILSSPSGEEMPRKQRIKRAIAREGLILIAVIALMVGSLWAMGTLPDEHSSQSVFSTLFFAPFVAYPAYLLIRLINWAVKTIMRKQTKAAIIE